MEKNLGFFEAWRARRKEKKEEEEAASLAAAARRLESGAPSAYTRLSMMLESKRGSSGVVTEREFVKSDLRTSLGGFEGVKVGGSSTRGLGESGWSTSRRSNGSLTGVGEFLNQKLDNLSRKLQKSDGEEKNQDISETNVNTLSGNIGEQKRLEDYVEKAENFIRTNPLKMLKNKSFGKQNMQIKEKSNYTEKAGAGIITDVDEKEKLGNGMANKCTEIPTKTIPKDKKENANTKLNEKKKENNEINTKAEGKFENEKIKKEETKIFSSAIKRTNEKETGTSTKLQKMPSPVIDKSTFEDNKREDEAVNNSPTVGKTMMKWENDKFEAAQQGEQKAVFQSKSEIGIETDLCNEKKRSEIDKVISKISKSECEKLENGNDAKGNIQGSLGEKVENKISDVKPRLDSRSSTSSVVRGSSSIRRGSSAFSSFTNIQEKIQALSQEQQSTELKKTPKVNKLGNEALKIGKLGTTLGAIKKTSSENNIKGKVGNETDSNASKATTKDVKSLFSVDEKESKVIHEVSHPNTKNETSGEEIMENRSKKMEPKYVSVIGGSKVTTIQMSPKKQVNLPLIEKTLTVSTQNNLETKKEDTQIIEINKTNLALVTETKQEEKEEVKNVRSTQRELEKEKTEKVVQKTYSRPEPGTDSVNKQIFKEPDKNISSIETEILSKGKVEEKQKKTETSKQSKKEKIITNAEKSDSKKKGPCSEADQSNHDAKENFQTVEKYNGSTEIKAKEIKKPLKEDTSTCDSSREVDVSEKEKTECTIKSGSSQEDKKEQTEKKIDLKNEERKVLITKKTATEDSKSLNSKIPEKDNPNMKTKQEEKKKVLKKNMSGTSVKSLKEKVEVPEKEEKKPETSLKGNILNSEEKKALINNGITEPVTKTVFKSVDHSNKIVQILEKEKVNSNDSKYKGNSDADVIKANKEELNVNVTSNEKNFKKTAKLPLEEKTKSGFRKVEVAKEAQKIQETMTRTTNQANEAKDRKVQQLPKDKNTGEDGTDSNQEGSLSEVFSFRKDQSKLLKNLKGKSNLNECYPKTQKLLVGKAVNAFEQAHLEESRRETIVSPTKVEAFLMDTINSPVTTGSAKDPPKTMGAVVEEIVTSKSDKCRHEKPRPIKYSSRGEVILGSVSIKPETETDMLSAITLVPAFRPEKPIFVNETVKTEKDECEKEIEKECKKLEMTPFNRERSPFSPLSDFSDDSYDHYVASVDYSLGSSSYDRYSLRRSLRSSSAPRRVFPQMVAPSNYKDLKNKEDSPVVFDAGLSFDLSSSRTSLRRRFQPQPAFTDCQTSSNSLSVRIANFLKRTDHIMEEWKLMGKGDSEDLLSLVELPSRKILGIPSSRGRSATNIMIKGLLNFSKGSRASSVRSRSVARTSENSDRTISDIDELSEMTMDLSEERSAGTAQAERLEAETAERVRLEQELSQIQTERKNLQQTSERLEMELFYARADVNGLSESEGDLEDGGGDASLYKNKWERTVRELEFTRRRLQQQHEDDLEQLVGLKKQLEKKLTDAYEEVEEQRQVAGQWKRKVQKLQSETNDLRLLLEEQSSRNNLLEKKQRKFDSEIQILQEELRSEKNQKDRLSREKEMASAEKYSLEQNLSSVRLELELKEEKLATLTREMEELTLGGGTEQEIAQLRKAKHELEMKLKEQEEELDELAGQVSMLEGNKLRLEMSLESLRKEHRREMAQRDDELDEARSNAHKKIKVLESQLESEHEERTLLVREKHELERRLADAEERGKHHRAADEDALLRARRDLKRTKALLRDAQVMLDRAKQDSPSKAALRALKNQLEDAELARASAVKAKQSLESELNEVTGQLEEALRAKGDAENRCQAALRETNALRTQVEENEEELAELLKKYRQTVQQLSAEQLASQETAGALAEAEAERAALRDQLAEVTARLEASAVVDPVGGIAQKKLEIRVKELESRLELEQTTRSRLEVQIARLKENVERLNEECVQARTKEQLASDLTRKLQRSLREAKEELAVQLAKEQEAIHRRKDLEKRLDTAEHEASTAKTDLRLALKRIEDLQSAISGEIETDSDRSESEEEDSGDDSIISHVPSTMSSTPRISRTPDLAPR